MLTRYDGDNRITVAEGGYEIRSDEDPAIWFIRPKDSGWVAWAQYENGAMADACLSADDAFEVFASADDAIGQILKEPAVFRLDVTSDGHMHPHQLDSDMEPGALREAEYLFGMYPAGATAELHRSWPDATSHQCLVRTYPPEQ